MNQAKTASVPSLYNPTLHSVRRVRDADFQAGYRLKAGMPVACSGAWDRKAIITKVLSHGKVTHSSRYSGTSETLTAIKCEVMFVGHYFLRPSQRIGHETRHNYDWETRQSTYTKRGHASRFRHYNQRYVAPSRVSRSVMTVYFNADGSIRLPHSGWVPVIAR